MRKGQAMERGIDMKTLRFAALAVAALVLLTGSAISQGESAIDVTTVAEIEVASLNDDGEKETERVPAATVVPGDVVIFTIMYTSVSDKPADNVVITNAIPDQMTYWEKSAVGVGTVITFSVDGGRTYGTPSELMIPDADGTPARARAEDYTHVRWILNSSLAPKEGGVVEYRARLI